MFQNDFYLIPAMACPTSKTVEYGEGNGSPYHELSINSLQECAQLCLDDHGGNAVTVLSTLTLTSQACWCEVGQTVVTFKDGWANFYIQSYSPDQLDYWKYCDFDFE